MKLAWATRYKKWMFTFIGFTGWLKNVFAMYEVFMKKHKKKVKIHEKGVYQC